jgi:PAS domain S-box-containing protein
VPYGLAILIPLVAYGLTFGIDHALDGDIGFAIYFIAVAIVGWRGGLGPGLLAAAVCGVAEAASLVSAPGSSALHVSRLVLFGLACIVVSLLTDRLRGAQQRAGQRGQLAREREERLELTLEASQTGVWDWDVRQDSLTWSARFAELHDLSAGDSTSVPMIDVLASIVEEDRAAVAGAVQRSVESGNPYDVEYRALATDGSLHWVNSTGRTTAWVDGRPTRMVGIVRDVTTWRDAEADRDRLLAAERHVQRIRDAFIEVLSHEFRTPMTTIIGGAELLERGRLSTDRVLEVAHDVREEAERMIRLIEDLLVLSRAERGSLEISDEPVLVQRVVDRVARDIQRRQPSLVIDLALATDLPPVRGELTYVEQVLRNLVGNAAKYGPASGPIRIAGAVVDGWVEIRVLDAGPGIQDDDLERVFELFYRSRETASRVSGAGIGLFVCRQLVELMGGRIWCRPRPAGGSEFGFTLPLEMSDGLG